MSTKHLLAALTAAGLFCQGALAQDQTRDQDQTRTQTQTQDRTRETLRDRDIYGSQMMTPAERNEYRERMRAAKTAQERERIRAEHHERMKERAKERNIMLPEAPPMGRGPGMGSQGPGAGGGMMGGGSSGGGGGRGR